MTNNFFYYRIVTAIGTSSLVVSSGIVAWQLYRLKFMNKVTPENVNRLNQETMHLEQETGREEREYIPIPQHILDNINQYDEMKLSPLETKEDIKSIIPRNLKRSWRLMEQANRGSSYRLHYCTT